MAFDPKQFTSSLLDGAQVDPATRAQLEAIINNPALQPKFKDLDEGSLRQSEFSKKMAEYTDKVKAAQEYWDGLQKWDKDTKGKLEAEVASLKAKLTGDDAGLTHSPGEPQTGYKEELQKLAQEAIAYNNTVMQLGLKHYKEFGEILDTNDLIKIANVERVNIAQAYDKFVQPKRDELQKADIVKQLAAAREEGRMEAIKNGNMPISNIPSAGGNPSPLDGLNGAGRSSEGGAEPKYGSMAAVKAFSENMRKGIVAPAI